ncbi:ChrR family anti-sigma-E factor [Pseudooceanicola nanhaiensis]|jgi:putative transcriptional regulator|uniref:Anti-sigma-E factor ChrR n=2 Tax=Pseudooceanicola nanhaiensis TaxID=375761 RepID=A0A917SZJ9_9RHOB|nr:ChrR family anti-sigma-E factor [Pseudooceanicola nanhaiensis]GGM03961.1 anti-sigma-E factor ChrR [Pseudooceanicola nanhaiensis]
MNSEVRHHLSEELLTAYAAGALPEAFALVVATHLSMCDECRAMAESLDGIGGTLIEGLDGAAMDAGALEAVMARLDDAPAAPIRVDRGVLPAPVRAYIGGDLDAVKWKPVGMGVKQAVLKTSDSASARLLYIPAGAAMPEHSHRGMELTLVLQGAFEDDSDRFGPGDVEIADDEVDHTPVADVGADCICLAATEGRLRFKSWIPRLAQPFIGI